MKFIDNAEVPRKNNYDIGLDKNDSYPEITMLEEHILPVGPKDRCNACGQKVGERHLVSCEDVTRTLVINFNVEQRWNLQSSFHYKDIDELVDEIQEFYNTIMYDSYIEKYEGNDLHYLIDTTIEVEDMKLGNYHHMTGTNKV